MTLLSRAVAAFAAIAIAGSLAQAPARAQTAPNLAELDVPALLKSGALKGRKLVFSGWGGVQGAATMKNFVIPFQQDTGVQVTMLASGSGFAAKLSAQEQAKNVQWDIIDGPGSDGDILFSLGHLQEFPLSLSKALAPLVRPETIVENWRLRYGQAPLVYACNPAVMAKCPLNPKDFWDTTNFPGPRGITITLPVKSLTIALLASGVPRDKLFPLDIPRAVASLQKIKPAVKVWAETSSQSQQVLADGEVGAEILSNGRANDLKRSMPNLQISWDGAVVDPDGWIVPKGAANADVAFAFLLWVAQHPSNQAAWTEAMLNLTPTNELAKLLPADIRARTALDHDPVEIPHEVVANQRKDIQAGMQAVLSGR